MGIRYDPDHTEGHSIIMKLLLLAALAAAAAAAPQNYRYAEPAPRQILDSDESFEVIPILRDDRVQEEDGTYTVDIETGNGIVLSQARDSSGEQQGVISFTHPDGTPFHMTYIADENGFQPQSDALPVAPAFPHPIPDFVLEQIEFARLNPQSSEEQSVRVPSSRYGRPDSSEEQFRKKRQAPAYEYAAPRRVDSDESLEVIPIVRDVRVQEEDGTYTTSIETGNGIVISQAGDSSGEKQGVISFTHPDGTPFHMTYIADENGFQPQSDALPVAPAFPHPIPDFVLEQIEFARQQKEFESREVRVPSSR